VARATEPFIVTVAAQCRPLWLAYVLMIPTVVLSLAFLVGLFNMRSDPRELAGMLRDLPIFFAAGSICLPVALWRNWFRFDPARGTLLHQWGYPFKLFGAREYPLDEFSSVEVDAVKPYWTTPGGRVTPLMHDGFANTGHRSYFDVVLIGKERSLLIQECHSYGPALAARRRLAQALGLPFEAEPAKRTFLTPNWHWALHFAIVGPAALTGGILLLVFAGPLLVAVAAALGLKKFAGLFLAGGFVLFPTALICLGSALSSLVPVACPHCGAKAYLTWSTRWAPGLSWASYICGGCRASWNPPV
jgi:hypothetical protein